MMIKPIILLADGVSRGKGQSVAGRMAYAQGTKYQDKYFRKTYYFGARTDLLHNEIILPENAPSEYRDGQTFLDAWNTSEKRKDALMAHQYILILPNELNAEEWLQLARAFAQANFVKEGFPVYFAIHRGLVDKHIKPAGIRAVVERQDNPHIHMLVAFRQVGKDGFCSEKSKGRTTYQKRFLYHLRESWAEIQNRSFERLGIDVRVTADSYQKRGISRKPTIHLGPWVMAKEAAGVETKLGNQYREILAENQTREQQIEAELQREAERQQEYELDRER